MATPKFLGFSMISDEGENYIKIEDFWHFLKQNFCPEQDAVKELRKTSFTLELKGTKIIYGEKYANVLSVLKYIVNHTKQLGSCNSLAKKVLKKLCDKEEGEIKTVLGFYKTFANSKVKEKVLNYSRQQIDIDETKISTLFEEYKDHFKEEDWQAICLLENYISLYIPIGDDLDEGILKRHQALEHLETAIDFGEQWIKNSVKVIQKRQQRRQVSTEQSQIQINARQIHVPVSIENDIIKYLDIFYSDIIDSVCVVDDDLSSTENSVLVFIDLAVKDNDELKNIRDRVLYTINDKHHLNCKIVFLASKSLEKYMNKNGAIGRFSLRDDFIAGKVKGTILEIHTPESSDLFVENEKCESCFTDCDEEELNLAKFDISNEWKTSVPLDIQLVLECFINKASFYYALDKKVFLHSKLQRLYNVYDVLLNTYNKKYSGILQDANTDELMMHYKSINTVFNIASHAGATASLNCADKRLKERADPETCYYNTYLKHYPLLYQTASGLEEKLVSLRECHVILMLDNLVRIKYKPDPVPGESRSQQICTLPITLQGLPKDNMVTESWHNQSLCDGTVHCPCKKKKLLLKEEVALLYTPTDAEELVLDKFRQMCNWSLSSVWQSIEASGILKFKSNTSHAEGGNNTLPTIDSTQIDLDEDTGTKSVLQDDWITVPGGNADSFLFESTMEVPSDNSIQMHELEHTGAFSISTALQQANAVLDKDIEEIIYDNIDDDKNTNDIELDLYALLQEAVLEEVNPEFTDIVPLDTSINDLEKSFQNMSLPHDESESQLQENGDKQESTSYPIPVTFGLNKYSPPPLLCKHPPPFHGKDDDIIKLKEILDDILVKLGKSENNDPDRILIGVDNKIGKNVLHLARRENKYQRFLAEFPLLHLRKSKIGNLFASYKSAGLVQLLMFMKDDTNSEWAKLLTIEHIDVATKYIRRLSMSLHLAFLLMFISGLSDDESSALIVELKANRTTNLLQSWHTRFMKFMKDNAEQNCTFALHRDMMVHMDEIVAIQVAERLGGSTGYNLLLSTVKSSLPFTFLNGSSSYAPFCTQLILEHLQAGYFHQKLKENLFSTPIGKSTVNFACDTKREIDHQDILKGFRSGSTISSVSCRMSLIDSLTEVHDWGKADRKDTTPIGKVDDLGWKFTAVDMKHIIPTAEMILRRGGITTQPSTVAFNVYMNQPQLLTSNILDDNTYDIGRYLINKYVAKESLIAEMESPNIQHYTGPSTLLKKAQKSKGVTLRRATAKISQTITTEREVKEQKRQLSLKRDVKQINHLTSDMNTCQALVKPDCTKPKVQKSSGVQKALINLLKSNTDTAPDIDQIIQLNQKEMPPDVTRNVELVTVEFAGVKFKTKSHSGLEYLKNIESSVLRKISYMFPKTSRIIVCEEKYSFTPDDLKASTRQQRKKDSGISHLKTTENMISTEKFDKCAVVTTTEGKSIVSTFLAQNADKLRLKRSIVVDIDSEFIKRKNCSCHNTDLCTCTAYCIPLRCHFEQPDMPPNIMQLEHIRQCKGEAELAQIDWLFEDCYLTENGAVVSLVTSGDIDAVVVHLFVLSRLWPRDGNRKFSNAVYVVLQKPQKYDVYNITRIIEALEKAYPNDRDIAIKVSFCLSIGGNDFLPKFYGISHDAVLKRFLDESNYLENLFQIDSTGNQYRVNADIYIDFIKALYTPKNKEHSSLSFKDVRRLSMQSKRKSTSPIDIGGLRNAQSWMPPEGALLKLVKLTELFVQYLGTTGYSAALMPNFLEGDCLTKSSTGDIEYDFGPESRAALAEIRDMCAVTQKRRLQNTPQKGMNRKKMLTSTPKKS